MTEINTADVCRCENLADLIWQNRQQITEVDLLRAQLPIDLPAGRQDLVPILRDTITRLLSSLVTRYHNGTSNDTVTEDMFVETYFVYEGSMLTS